MALQKVKFKSGGVNCAGDLYVPDNYRPGSRSPGLVIGHGFSLVKQGLADEGGYFSRAGFVTLAIDYRTFGESEGEPRGQLFPLNQVEDFRNAISYLQTRPEVDPKRIGIWGKSMGGAVVIYTAAVDRRVKAVVAHVPVVNGRRWAQSLRTSDQWLELLDKLDEDRKRRYETGLSMRIPAIGRGAHGEFCAMPADQDLLNYFATARENFKTWRPDVALESVEKVIEFNPENYIHLISPRALCIISTVGYDMIHPLEHILDAYRKAHEPKKLVQMPYNQLELYTEPMQSEAMAAVIDWFNKYL